MLSLLHTLEFVSVRLFGRSPEDLAKDKQSVEEVVRKYILDDKTYENVRDLMLKDMLKGLQPGTNASADLKMLPTYVRSLPNGSERGSFLALDLGGTNFRVLLIDLKDSSSPPSMKHKIYPISEVTMTGPGTNLFDHIASCIYNFIVDNHIAQDPKRKLPLGFTFSFPCKQEGLAVGRLLQWTKGFNCEGVVGENVVQLLHEAIERRDDLFVECVAILNDTVGCLMSCAYTDHNTELGVILGTGTNACYMEQLNRVGTWDGDMNEPAQVIINTEWGAFGDSGVLDFLRTDADNDIDQSSINPGKQIYEKMISGMYMGELVRRVMLQCAQTGSLFKGRTSEVLRTPNKFFTKYVSEIESDHDGDHFPNTTQVLEEIGIEYFSTEDCRHVRMICQAVSSRAAYLASAGIACLLNRVNKPKVTVAVDGSLYRFHPHFHDLMMSKIKQLLHPDIEFHMKLSQDGSGIGAAKVAAVVDRLSRQSSMADTTSGAKQNGDVMKSLGSALESLTTNDAKFY